MAKRIIKLAVTAQERKRGNSPHSIFTGLAVLGNCSLSAACVVVLVVSDAKASELDL